MSQILDKKQHKDIVTDLQKLGLSEKEAMVFLALITLGEVGSSKIIRATDLHGQYVYQALEKLTEKGLVQYVIKRGRKKFSAKNPNTLLRLIDNQKRIANNLVDELDELFTLPPEQRSEIFQGKESYIAHEFEMLEHAKKGSTLLVIGGQGDQFLKTMGDSIIVYDILRKKKNITVRYIGSEEQREDLAGGHGKRGKFEIRLLPGLFTGSVNTNVWPDAIGFNMFGDPVTRFTLWNPVVAGSYSQFFETLWKMAKP